MWYNHFTHATTENYGNNGKYWYFQVDSDTKITYTYNLWISLTSIGHL